MAVVQEAIEDGGCCCSWVCAEEFTSDEEISLRHMEHFLERYDKYLVVPQGLSINRPGFRVMGLDQRFFGSHIANTRLLLSPSFYKMFADYKFILLCHLDALVFSDRLEEWCDLDLDYIAAPWIKCDDSPYVVRDRVGNGGFSLRKVESFLRVIYSDQYWVEPDAYWRSVCAQNSGLSRFPFLVKSLLEIIQHVQRSTRQEMASWYLRADGRQNEDFFWADEAVTDTTLNLKWLRWRSGYDLPFGAAPRRCFELNHGNLPFGCHAWPRYDRAFWEPYLLK